ncbi:RNA polymerase subunit sigma-24, partial [Rhizobium leguminosarum]
RVDAQELELLLQAFVSAWECRYVTAMVNLLAYDVRFTMPPLPAWFSVREFVGKFFAERVFETPWWFQGYRRFRWQST